ncbi:MAG TPA: hypothetical protein VE998_09935 [Terriglobales bacterium]|nr:hypothetical protein [Terriglobales bacterium]
MITFGGFWYPTVFAWSAAPACRTRTHKAQGSKKQIRLSIWKTPRGWKNENRSLLQNLSRTQAAYLNPRIAVRAFLATGNWFFGNGISPAAKRAPLRNRKLQGCLSSPSTVMQGRFLCCAIRCIPPKPAPIARLRALLPL